MSSFLTCLFVLLLSGLLLFIAYIFVRPKFSPLHKLQGPPVNGLFTSHLDLILNVSASHKQMDMLVKRYGTSFRINGMASHDERLVTVDPVAMSYVLNRPWIYQKPWQSRRLITRLIGEGLLGSEGIIHKRLRKLSNPAFSQQSLREFLPTFFKKALELKKRWEQIISENHGEHEIDICHWLGRLTVDIIGETGFDYTFNAIHSETNEVYLAFRDMFAAVFTSAPQWEIVLGVYLPLFNKLWRSKTNLTVDHSQRVIQRVGKDLIKRKKEAFEKGIDPGKDLLTLLRLSPSQSSVKSNYSDEIPVDQRASNEDLFNQVSTFLFAGSDTSSLALTWTLQLLTEHPDMQIRLRQEFHDSQQSESDVRNILDLEDDIPYADMYKAIDALPFLDNVIRESLRLIPPIHSSLRVATRDDYIPFSEPVLLRDGTKQQGIGIKKGQMVHVSIEAFNVNKNVWGEDAWSFNPDRWLNIPDKAKQQPGLYPNNMSFSAGPRSCIAMTFSLMEIKVVLYVLLSSFTFEKTASIMKVYTLFEVRSLESNIGTEWTVVSFLRHLPIKASPSSERPVLFLPAGIELQYLKRQVLWEKGSLPSTSMSTIVPEDHHLPPPQRRIRHIKSIQIRNLTPFPARDAIAQSLTQPSRNAAILPQYPADDIELGASRRKRRISSGSIILPLNPDTEDDESTPLTGSVARRKRSTSKSSLQTTSSSPSTSHRLSSNSRPLLNSMRHVVTFADAPHALDTQTPSPLFVIHSQKHLEKIVSSRLIETFITLSPLSSAGDTPSSPLISPVSMPSSPNAVISATKKPRDLPSKKASPVNKPEHRKVSSVSSTNSHKSSSVSRTSVTPVSTSRSKIGGSHRASTSKASFTSPPTPPPESPRARLHNPLAKSVSSKPNSRAPDEQQDEPEPEPAFTTPFYISPIHKPSTNPMFTHLDPEREFANWADITSPSFQVIIWGCTTQSDRFAEDVKGKGKEKIGLITESMFKGNSSWQILDTWIIDLDEVELFTLDSSSQRHALPSNTLLITLSSGETFRVSPVSAERQRAADFRSHSPVEPEYNSDGDIERLRGKQENISGKDRDTVANNLRETRMKKSATYQDLVKLINLQTVIADTRQLLENTISTCNTLLESDTYNPLYREITELEEWVETLRNGKARVEESVAQDSLKLEERRKALQQRRENLAVARDLYCKDVEEYSERQKEFTAERERHAQLAPQLPALRTSLLYLVNFIFPIEPVSPPDFLFAILGAPLPVPQSSTDPAPPISMPKFPSVSEESVSTALGYVAQVVQLISAYLGQILVYPVTCYGSRSVIKDPVSAMTGPRVFPLYSKGVETYRFEYGVYLLNKNIEMLMSERNLRALDIRHTLPNLKNLMLTLTMGEEVKPMDERKQPSEFSEVTSPVSSSEQIEVNSSSTSPTVSTEHPLRKSTPFLSPFTSLLRSRYPSSLGRPKIKPVDETPEQTEDTQPTVVASTPSELSFRIEVTTEESKDISSTEESHRDVTSMNGSPLEKHSLNGTISPPSPSVSEIA